MFYDAIGPWPVRSFCWWTLTVSCEELLNSCQDRCIGRSAIFQIVWRRRPGDIIPECFNCCTTGCCYCHGVGFRIGSYIHCSCLRAVPYCWSHMRQVIHTSCWGVERVTWVLYKSSHIGSNRCVESYLVDESVAQHKRQEHDNPNNPCPHCSPVLVSIRDLERRALQIIFCEHWSFGWWTRRTRFEAIDGTSNWCSYDCSHAESKESI